MNIGVLALQGAFIEHRKMLERCGQESKEIRRPQHLENIDGLIIPGGESTTIGKLLVDYQLLEPVLERAHNGMPIFGTCAGMVLLANNIEGSGQPRLGLMDIKVVRNAYGRQVDSFETDLPIRCLGEKPFHAVFIRAPYVAKVGKEAECLCRYEGKAVFVRQGRFLASAFHPELTEDTRIHEYFLDMVRESVK